MVSALMLAAIIGVGCTPEATPATPVVAIVTIVKNLVEIRAATSSTPTPATSGTGWPTGATLSTGAQSEAAVEFGGSSAIRLQAQSEVTLLRIVQLGTGPTVHVQLNSGGLLASAPDGWLVIETILGQVSLPGAAAQVDYAPGSYDPQDDVLAIRCLAGGCEVQGRLGGRTLGPGEQLVIADSGMTLLQSEFDEAQLVGMLGDQAPSVLNAATLTAWPNGLSQPTATATASITPIPTATPTVLRVTSARPATATATRTSTETATLTEVSPSATTTRRPQTRTATPTPTQAPTVFVPPSTSTPAPVEPPPPAPTATDTPVVVPPSVTPSSTVAPSATHTPARGPSKTP